MVHFEVHNDSMLLDNIFCLLWVHNSLNVCYALLEWNGVQL